MNKILYIIRNILLLILSILFINSSFTYGLFNNTSEDLFMLSLLLVILIGLSIKDIFTKDKINYNNTFNILGITIFTTMILVYVRGYSNNFIYNSKEYMDILKNVLTTSEYNGLSNYIKEYLNQNTIYFIGLLLSLIIYRKINKDKNDKYNIVSLICFYLSIASIYLAYKGLFVVNIGFTLGCFILNTILVVTEIYRLIKDLHKKENWIIIVSFIFNIISYVGLYFNTYLLIHILTDY